MELKELIAQTTAAHKYIGGLLALAKRIDKLDLDRAQNLRELNTELTKLGQALERASFHAPDKSQWTEWIESYRKQLSVAEEKLAVSFGNDLERVLTDRQIPLAGQYPTLRAGMFIVKVDFKSFTVETWFGVDQELLERHPLRSGEHTAKRILEWRDRMGTKDPPETFVEKLTSACETVTRGKVGSKAPILAVLHQMAILQQRSKWRDDPRPQHFSSYTRADFGYDLYRYLRPSVSTLFSRRIALVPAVRQLTKSRGDFLWVPEDERGNGHVYSHLQLEDK